MNQNIRGALQYILNTGESVNAEAFDEDHDPIGVMLRQDIAPYVTTNEHGVLKLTAEARQLLGETDGKDT